MADNKKLSEMPPVDLDEDQVKEYDFLLRQSRLLFPEIDDFVLKIGVAAYVRKTDKTTFADPEEIQKLKQEYTTYKFEAEELAKKPLELSKSYIDNNNEVLQADSETHIISS